MIEERSLDEFIEFMKLVGKLKTLKRTGWVNQFHMKHPETVADHSFRTAMIAMVFSDMYNQKAEKKIDTEKMIRLALLHDVHESIMGDWDDTIKREKGLDEFEKEELNTIQETIDVLPKPLQKRYRGLWDELIAQETIESRLIKQMDRLECSFQAIEYSQLDLDKETLKKWLDHDDNRIEQKDLSRVLKKLMEEM